MFNSNGSKSLLSFVHLLEAPGLRDGKPVSSGPEGEMISLTYFKKDKDG